MNRLNALDFCLQIFKYQIILNLFNFFQAFTSWICYYKTFEADLRKYFCFKNLHLGHLAGNLGLRDSPGDIARDAVRNQEERKDKKMWDFIKLFFFSLLKCVIFTGMQDWNSNIGRTLSEDLQEKITRWSESMAISQKPISIEFQKFQNLTPEYHRKNEKQIKEVERILMIL